MLVLIAIGFFGILWSVGKTWIAKSGFVELRDYSAIQSVLATSKEGKGLLFFHKKLVFCLPGWGWSDCTPVIYDEELILASLDMNGPTIEAVKSFSPARSGSQIMGNLISFRDYSKRILFNVKSKDEFGVALQSEWFWFDTENSSLEEAIHFEEKLVEFGFDIKKGSLRFLEKLSAEYDLLVDFQSGVAQNGNAINKAFVFRGDGTKIIPLEPMRDFYGFYGDEVFFWATRNAGIVTNWKTGQSRIISEYPPGLNRQVVRIPRDPTVDAINSKPLGGEPIITFSVSGKTLEASIPQAGGGFTHKKFDLPLEDLY